MSLPQTAKTACFREFPINSDTNFFGFKPYARQSAGYAPSLLPPCKVHDFQSGILSEFVFDRKHIFHFWKILIYHFKYRSEFIVCHGKRICAQKLYRTCIGSDRSDFLQVTEMSPNMGCGILFL